MSSRATVIWACVAIVISNVCSYKGLCPTTVTQPLA
jgi:hypothetical protein